MTDRGNYVSEWFGHRIYPSVTSSPQALADQRAGRCPFLSAATLEDRPCVKSKASSGVCSISSTSNGTRQDWLVCPYRAVERGLLDDVAGRLFGDNTKGPRLVEPAPRLRSKQARDGIEAALSQGRIAVVFFQDKLGGEISLSKTDRSPEFSFDITLVELLRSEAGEIVPGRFGILEVQTMDFHGSYRAVVKNLEDAMRLHAGGFAEAIEKNPHWLSERIEGPNIANVFKRTFYQVMLKFRVGAEPSCAGCVLALPRSVWDSWQRHLGAPELASRPDGSFLLAGPRSAPHTHPPAWIYVFDIETGSSPLPSSLPIQMRIATDAEAISHFALEVAPEAALAGGDATSRLAASIRRRLSFWWPEFPEIRLL